MAKMRRKMSRKANKRNFKRGTKTHKRNLMTGTVMRGGYRL